MNLARTYAIVFGVVYALVGILGFFVAPGLASHNLILFPVNGPHNAVHLIAGLAGIGAFMGGRAVEYGRVMGVVFIVLALVGLVLPDGFGLVPLGGADVVLHAATGILGLVAGFAYSQRTSVRTA